MKTLLQSYELETPEYVTFLVKLLASSCISLSLVETKHLLASEDNHSVKFMGAAGRKKHEKKTDDCRSSIHCTEPAALQVTLGRHSSL
jgi:hypothetical protein